jgi:pimeloyl-ACP methyl ester carboxylesterase
MLYARLARYAATVCIVLTAAHGAISNARSGEAPGNRAVSEAWSAPPSAVTDEQRRDFNDGQTHLSGTLYYPRGAHKVPAVVALHGASSPTRDLPLYRHLRELLPPLGIAVFVFDRRGSGKSDSSSDNDDFDLLAADGIAARRMLAQDPRIDPARTGYWGISQGGWLALLAASKDPKTAFVISVSAPMTTPDVQMNFAVANILRVNGYEQGAIDAAIDTRRAVDDYLLGKLDRTAAEKTLDLARGRPWFKLAYLRDRLEDPKTPSRLKQIRFDPLATLDRLNMPVLLLFGSADPWTPVTLSMERLGAVARGHSNIEAMVVAGADHTMMLSLEPKVQMDPQSFPAQAPESAAYFGLMAAWLARRHFVHFGDR